MIDSFIASINDKNIKVDAKLLRRTIKEPFKSKKISHFAPEQQTIIHPYLNRLKKINVYVMENELEDYYTEFCNEQCKGISGKEEKPIFIVSQLITQETTIEQLVDCDEYLNFLNDVVAYSE